MNLNKLFVLLLSFVVLLSGAWASQGYGQATSYGQEGLYSTGGSWAFPSVNSSPFEQGAEYTIHNPYVIDAEYPAEAGTIVGRGYDNGYDYAGYPAQGAPYGGPFGGAPYGGYAAFAGAGPAYGNQADLVYPPGDQTVYNLGNGYVSEGYNAGGKINLPEQSFNNRVYSNPLYSEIGLVLSDGGQGFTIQEGESAYKNVFIKNESAEPFYVDEVRVNADTLVVNAQVVGALSTVVPRTQGSVKLALEGLSVESDQEVQATITVIGHFPSLQQQVIGPKTFLIYVNAQDPAPALPTAAGTGRAIAATNNGYAPAQAQAVRPRADEAPAAPSAPAVVSAPAAVDIVNHSEAVQVMDKAELKVTLRNNAAEAKKVFVDVPSDKVDVRGQDVELAPGETKTVKLEVLPLSQEEGIFNAALTLTVDGQEVRQPVAFQIEKTAVTGMLPKAGQLVKDGVTALASLGTTSWLVGMGLVILFAAFYVRSRDSARIVLDHEAQAWVHHKPRHRHAAH